jgi:hypothetical protein
VATKYINGNRLPELRKLMSSSFHVPLGQGRYRPRLVDFDNRRDQYAATLVQWFGVAQGRAMWFQDLFNYDFPPHRLPVTRRPNYFLVILKV